MEMDYDVWRCYVRDHIESSLENIEVWQCITALGIKPYRKEDGEWCFHYGYTNGQDDGISGFGRTINEAAMDFFVNMKYDNGSYFSESELD
jgi:hypothetical protein